MVNADSDPLPPQHAEFVARAQSDGAVIYLNDEVGIWQWSVVVYGTDYWLDSFDSSEGAIAYCKEHNIPYEEGLNVPNG